MLFHICYICFILHCSSSLCLDADSLRNCKTLENILSFKVLWCWYLCYLTLHILDHADHSPQSWSINAVSIICNNLPSSPGTKSSLDAEGHFLILDRSFIMITSSVRTVVPERQYKDIFDMTLVLVLSFKDEAKDWQTFLKIKNKFSMDYKIQYHPIYIDNRNKYWLITVFLLLLISPFCINCLG